MQKNALKIIPPLQAEAVLLHSCCAPCSCAIVEALLGAGIKPVIFYYNPNISPLEEYEKRKGECRRFADANAITQIDGDYCHGEWLGLMLGLELEPERGARCQACFDMRLLKAARKAKELGIKIFTTTLASSRWKNLEQINAAGARAQMDTGVVFWAQNWRKGGLQQRRRELIKEYSFYNQTYCGCEFSTRQEPREFPREK